MNNLFLSATELTLGEGALYSLVGLIIVLIVLALLVGIFYLSGYLFGSELFRNNKKTNAAHNAAVRFALDDDDELTAAITAAIFCILSAENGGAPPEFVIKRIKRK